MNKREKLRQLVQHISDTDEENAILRDGIARHSEEDLDSLVSDVMEVVRAESEEQVRQMIADLHVARLRLIFVLAENALKNYVHHRCQQELEKEKD